MELESILSLVSEHRDDISRFGVRRLALFGSVARGEATGRSDVDVLVDFHGSATFDAFVDLQFYLEALLNRRVDLVTERSLRQPFRRLIEQDVVDVPGLSPVSR